MKACKQSGLEASKIFNTPIMFLFSFKAVNGRGGTSFIKVGNVQIVVLMTKSKPQL